MQFRHSALVIAATLIAASSSFAAIGDPCTPDVVNPDTGVVTTENFANRCDGTQLVVCSKNDDNVTLETAIQCATFGGIEGGTCSEFSGGPNCAVPDAEGCFFTSPDGTTAFRLPCATATSGCIGGVCTPNNSCTAGAPAASPCAGDLVDLGCSSDGQKFQLDCGTIAFVNQAPTPSSTATCEVEASEAVCKGAVANDSCAEDFVECNTGLSCNGETETSFGKCGTPPVGEGEGEGGDDNPRRDNDAEDAPACSNAAGLTPTFAGLLLALVAVRRRRR